MQKRPQKDSEQRSSFSSEEEDDTALSSHKRQPKTQSFGSIEQQSMKKSQLHPQYHEMFRFIEKMKKDFKR